VELLVSVVLAGIVFSAMVPVFVSTQKASATDRARNIGVNIAQDRLEKIRLLAFEQIAADGSNRAANQVDANLYDPSLAGGQFATPYTPPGSAHAFTVDYVVDNVPSTGAINYKQITVTVSWDSPAQSGSPVVLHTLVMNPAATSTSSAPVAASIASFTPLTGPAGTVVTIVGQHFTGATAVKFNGTAATSFTVVSDTQITATVPGTATSGPISVTSPGGTATSAVSFAVASPATYSLTVMVNYDYINPTTGVTVTRTDVTPNETRTPSPQFPTTTSPGVWSGLPAGTYLVTCNYYKNNKKNGNGPQTRTQTVYVTSANQTLSFDLTQ
jgi:type II secretory pathway pseudopilin PulG